MSDSEEMDTTGSDSVTAEQPPMDTTGGDSVTAEQPPISEEAKKEWGEDISPDKDEKVFKRVLVEGQGEEYPAAGDEVYVHYTGRLLDGTVFDSSVERNELFQFKLGEGKVIKGWDTGVATMKRGEKCLLTCSPDYAYGSSGSPPKIPPNATLQFEVELFKWRGEDVTGDSGVLKSTTKKGEGYVTPKEGATVTVLMRGRCEDKVIEDRELEFTLGEGCEVGVIDGVERALLKMKKGETANVEIGPKYAYGTAGSDEKGVPPNATLHYTITLNNFDKVKSSYDYENVQEKITGATDIKNKGTTYFKAGKIPLALKLYKRAADLVDSVYSDEDKKAAKEVRVLLHLNMAACLLKLKDGASALKDCEKVLELDDKSVKGHFRKGQAHVLLHDYEAAEQSFQEVLQLEPENKAAIGQRQACLKKLKEQERKERKMYQTIFAKLASTRDEEEKEEVVEERVKVVGGAQEKEAMEEEGPVKDAITVAAEQEEAAKENGLTQTGEPVEA